MVLVNNFSLFLNPEFALIYISLKNVHRVYTSTDLSRKYYFSNGKNYIFRDLKISRDLVFDQPLNESCSALTVLEETELECVQKVALRIILQENY